MELGVEGHRLHQGVNPMDDYEYQRAMKRSAEYSVPGWRQIQVFLALITFPLWIIPYWIVRKFRR